MKRYHTLALRELFAQKMTSFLILTAIVLSTMMILRPGPKYDRRYSPGNCSPLPPPG